MTNCYCVGGTARISAADYAHRVVGHLRDLTLPESRQSWYETSEDYLTNHPDNGKADPRCPTCNGSGVSAKCVQ